jgi:hypothetical protein
MDSTIIHHSQIDKVTTNRNGQYCNEWFQNPSSEAPLCDECWQFIIWHDAQFPLLDDNSEYMSTYASVSSSCGYAEQPTHTYEPLRISL